MNAALDRPRRPLTSRLTLLVVVLGLALAVVARGASLRRQQLDYWRGALIGGAVTTRTTVDEWYRERAADAEWLAASVASVQPAGGGHDAGVDTARLRRLVAPLGRRKAGVSLWVVDSAGAVLSGSRSAPLLREERDAVRRALRAGATTHTDVVMDSAKGASLSLAAPIRGAGGAAAVVLRADIVAAFSQWATGRPNSALSVLVTPAHDGVIVVRVCPEQPVPLCNVARPTIAANTAGALALAGRDSFGEFKGFNGGRILAATRYDSTLRWGVMRRVSVDDAFAQFRREAAIEASFLAALLALAGMGVFAANRNSRVRRLHARTRADERLAAVVDASIDGLVSLDERFHITMVNAAIERQFGQPRAALIGRPALDLFAPELRPFLAQRLEEFARSGMPHGTLADPHRSIARRSDGAYFPVDATLGRASLEGEMLFTLGVHDASERVRAEAFLQGQRHVLELIASRAPVRDALDALLSMVEVEASRVHVAAYELEDDGLTLRLVSAPGLSPDLATAIEEVIVGPASDSAGTAVFRGEPVYTEDIATDALWADSRDWVLTYGVRACWALPLRGGDGTLIGVLAFYCDAARGPTARERELMSAAVHLASIALSSARDAASLRRSEVSFRSFVENAPAAIFRETRHGHLVSSNPAMIALLGYPDAEMLVHASEAGVLYDDPAARERLLAALESGDVARGMELDWRRVDGTRVTVRLSARAYRDDRGRVWLWEGYAEDVTPLRHAEQALRQNEKLAAVGQLISGVAHELNNPLASILHFAEDLLADRRSAEDAEALSVIRDQARRSRAIVRDLLSFVQQREVRRESVSLGDTVVATVRAMTPTADRAGVRVHLDASRDPTVFVDRTGLEQIITNLLSNALQAAGEGGDVWVRTEAAGAWCSLVVEDSGPGIPPEIRPRIFDPFFTTKPTGLGTGLGLSVTLGLVEQFGGRIAADLRPDGARGSRFVVTLPVAPAAAEPVLARAGTAAAAAPPVAAVALVAPEPRVAPGVVRQVLVIDDEPTIRAALRRYFRRRGWEVSEAEDGAAALALLEADVERFALIVSDLRMPGFSGVELHDRLARRHPALLRRIVFSTGDVASAEAASFVQRTTCPVLQKPFELRTLDDLLARVVDGGAMPRIVA